MMDTAIDERRREHCLGRTADNGAASHQVAVATRRELLGAKIERLPEERQEFAKSINDLDQLERFLDMEANVIKQYADDKRAGEFGGYATPGEWFEKNPDDYLRNFKRRGSETLIQRIHKKE